MPVPFCSCLCPSVSLFHCSLLFMFYGLLPEINHDDDDKLITHVHAQFAACSERQFFSGTDGVVPRLIFLLTRLKPTSDMPIRFDLSEGGLLSDTATRKLVKNTPKAHRPTIDPWPACCRHRLNSMHAFSISSNFELISKFNTLTKNDIIRPIFFQVGCNMQTAISDNICSAVSLNAIFRLFRLEAYTHLESCFVWT